MGGGQERPLASLCTHLTSKEKLRKNATFLMVLGERFYFTHLSCINFILCVWVFCLRMCLCTYVYPLSPEECWMAWKWRYRQLVSYHVVLGIKSRASRRAARALNCSANSLPLYSFLKKYLFTFMCVPHVYKCHGGQKTMLDALELDSSEGAGNWMLVLCRKCS